MGIGLNFRKGAIKQPSLKDLTKNVQKDYKVYMSFECDTLAVGMLVNSMVSIKK